MAQLVKNPPANGIPGFNPWVGKIPWRGERLRTPVFWPRELVHGVAKSRTRLNNFHRPHSHSDCGDGGGGIARGKQFSQLPVYELPDLACWLDHFLDGQFQTAYSALLPQEAPSANSPFRWLFETSFLIGSDSQLSPGFSVCPSPLRECSSLFVLLHGCRVIASAIIWRER